MNNFMKHVGRHGDRKVVILWRQVPQEDHMCLVIYPETIPAHWQQAVQSVLESDIGQQAEDFADALHRNYLPDGRVILQTLHDDRMIKKIRTSDVLVTPRQNATIRLDELNKMLNEMKQGEAAIKKMAENDASRGMVAPDVKRRAEAEFKAEQAAKQTSTVNNNFQATESGALSDRDIAANKLAQANRMEAEAKQLIAEAGRMKKEAERMDPRVVAAPNLPVTEAPKAKRGRPAKNKAVVDATQ